MTDNRVITLATTDSTSTTHVTEQETDRAVVLWQILLDPQGHPW